MTGLLIGLLGGAVAFAALVVLLACTWLATRESRARWPILARGPLNAMTIALGLLLVYSSASLGMTAVQVATAGTDAVDEPTVVAGTTPWAGDKAAMGSAPVQLTGTAVRARHAVSPGSPVAAEPADAGPTDIPSGTDDQVATPVVPPTVANGLLEPIVLDPDAIEPVCDPAYPTLCLPIDGEAMDCLDAVAISFPVLAPDPYGLDPDGDGIGCEPATAPGGTPPPLLPAPDASTPLECDPSYPTLCIPLGSAGVDCLVLASQGVTGFPVEDPDTHNLDEDGDGIGCELLP